MPAEFARTAETPRSKTPMCNLWRSGMSRMRGRRTCARWPLTPMRLHRDIPEEGANLGMPCDGGGPEEDDFGKEHQVTKRCAPRRVPPASSAIAPMLPNNCPTISDKLILEAIFWPSWPLVPPLWGMFSNKLPESGQVWQGSGQNMSHIG